MIDFVILVHNISVFEAAWGGIRRGDLNESLGKEVGGETVIGSKALPMAHRLLVAMVLVGRS